MMKTEAEIDNFEKTQGQLESLYQEIGILSKKSQNDTVNVFKLKLVNNIIMKADALLGARYKPFDDFSEFDLDDLPSNSDVTMILGQYLNCMEKLRADNIASKNDHDGNKYITEWYWVINNKKSDIETKPPIKLGK